MGGLDPQSSAVRDFAYHAEKVRPGLHVLANETDGRDERSSIGDPIVQPGPGDGGFRPEVTIAYLAGYTPLKWISQGELDRGADPPFNLADAAVGTPVNPQAVNGDIIGLGLLHGTRQPEVGLKVLKSGRTSGITQGKIRVIHTIIWLVSPDTHRTYFFDDVILTTKMSEPGDSGAVCVDQGNRAVGLLFAGTFLYDSYNPITHVGKNLNLIIP